MKPSQLIASVNIDEEYDELHAEKKKLTDFLESIEGGRIVSSGDLTELQIGEAQAKGKFLIDPETAFGWEVVPWGLTTTKDREREAKYFDKTDKRA